MTGGVTTRWPWQRFFAICILAWAPFCLTQSALSQDTFGSASNTPELQQGEDAYQAKMAAWWRSYMEATEADDREAQDAIFQKFLDHRGEASAEIFEAPSLLFLRLAKTEMDAGRMDRARQEFLHAAQLNPYLMPAFTGLADSRLSINGDWQRYFSLNLKGFFSSFSIRNTYFFCDAMIWLFQNLAWLIILLPSLLAIIFAVKYFRTLMATVFLGREERGMNPVYARMYALGLVVSPLLFGLDPLVLGLFYLALFYPMMDMSEKYTAFIAAVLWGLIPFLYVGIANFNAVRSDTLLRAHLTQFFQGDYQQAIQRYRDLNVSGDMEDRTNLNIGLLQKASGDYPAALKTFQMISEASVFWKEAHNNIGNIYFIIKQYQDAIDHYEAVLEKHPNYATPLYNKSVVNARIGNRDQANTERNKAFGLDPSLRERVGSQELSDLTAVLDGRPPPLERLSGLFFSFQGVNVGQRLLNLPFFIPGLIVILVLILCVTHDRIRIVDQQAKACKNCGRIFLPSDSPNSEWCSQCVSIFLKKEDLPGEAKMKKHAEVRSFQRRRFQLRLFGLLVLPGFAKFQSDQTWLGFLLLSVWTALWLLILNPFQQIPHPSMLYMDSTHLFNYFIYGVTAVIWIVFGLIPVFRED
jgi:tetratricopeptide (TPR) repeat protein